MAMTRKFLKALGIDEEKVDQIIEAHTETVDALKADVDKYKQDAGKLAGVQKELDDLKAAADTDGGYKDKYEKEHAAFEKYKQDALAKDSRAEREKLFRAELEGLGITGKRADSVMRVSNLDEIKVKDGALEDAKAVQDAIKADWADFIPAKRTEGAKVVKPPENAGGKMTREEIMAIKDGAQRRAAIAENLDLFQ